MKKLISFAPAAMLAWGSLAAAAPPAAIPVSTKQMLALGITAQSLRRDAEPVVLSMPARVVLPPGGELVVSAPLAGLVQQVQVQPNQAVAKGTALVRIASPELAALQLNLMQAASRATLARSSAERERGLFSEGIVAERRVQEAEATLAEARAGLAQARAALRLAGMPAADIDRVSAGGPLQEAITIRAAAPGVVTAVEVRPGQRVEVAAALVQLAQSGRLMLEIDVPVAQAGSWPAGTRLQVRGAARGAVVASVSPLVAADSQTTTIRAELAPGHGLKPGQLVSAGAPLGADAGTWDVPLGALAHDGKQAYVFVRTRDGFEARSVAELGSGGQRVRVRGPLGAGDAVAVTGVVALKAAWQAAKGGQ